jgi:beta-carotene ketolase (CrtW type)
MVTKGLLIALAVYALWLGSLLFALSAEWTSAPAAGAMVLWQTFLYTGLFIQAHDGMHGALVPGRPRLNHAVARLFVWSYACFSYERLREKHLAHHAHAGVVVADPDFHRGHPGFWRWYLSFMFHYLTWTQYLWQNVVFFFLFLVLRTPWEQSILFWAMPQLLSTIQLFTFGTYLPHRPGGGLDENHSRNSGYSWALSFVTCYHFGYHSEHHRSSGTPWWRLPKLRRESA